MAEAGRPPSRGIPPAVLERGTRALIDALRREHGPGVRFIPRDVGEAAVAPEHPDVPGEVAARAPIDIDPVEERPEDAPPVLDAEPVPERHQRPARGQPRDLRR